MSLLSRKDPAHTSAENLVMGERGEPAVNRVVSMQSRANRILALGLASVLGLGVLVWYYSNAIGRQAHERETAKAAVTDRARGEMSLPSIGRIDPPPVLPEGAESSTAENVQSDVLDDQPLDMTQPIAPAYGSEFPHVPGAYDANGGAQPPYYGGAAEKTPEQLALERRLSGAAFAHSAQGTADSLQNALAIAPSEDSAASGTDRLSREDGMLATLLKPTMAPAVRAQILATQRFMLPKGAFIDCTLETAIDSTLPGMTTCITATDTFGADGKVVLLERGTKLIGETRGQVQQGSSRIFVLWTEARTPTGVIVPLDSPGADELGRSGLAGKTNRHFWDRFGAAILISMIDGAIQAKVQSQSSGGTVIYNPSGSQDIMTEVLKSTVNIPPTVTKSHGDRIQILVARDLDFRPVYELRSAIAVR